MSEESVFGPVAQAYFGVSTPDVHPSWLDTVFIPARAELEHTAKKLQKHVEKGDVIYPLAQNVFRIFKLVPLDEVKVVIVGQDPYYTPEDATGVAFSGGRQSVIPQSLKNIVKEISKNYTFAKEPATGCLEGWCEQGVLLLNSSLTVPAGRPLGCGGIWLGFMRVVVEAITNHNNNIPWLLWGASAKKLVDTRGMKLITTVLTAAHPSPRSYHLFKDCGHFVECNKILRENGEEEIDWTQMEPTRTETSR